MKRHLASEKRDVGVCSYPLSLADYLINETKANWMMVIKNTELISSLYPAGQKTVNGSQVYLNAFDKSYQVSFMNRNDKDVEHLIITNYEVQ